MKTVNPYNNNTIKEFDWLSDKELQSKLHQATETFDEYKRSAFPLRTELMKNVARLLEDNTEQYAKTITEEMGKPIEQSIAEVEKCIWVSNYYADNVKLFMRDEKIKTDATKSFICYEPLGVILGVMPWNFPFWQVFRFGVPAIMAGNVCLLKHAPRVPQCAIALENIFREAGFNEGVFQSLFIKESQVPTVLEHQAVQGVTVTGSVKAGAAVAAEAGKNIKKSVLELGGSDPFIVLGNANVKEAAQQGAQSRMLNTGQSCIAAKRFIVEESVQEDFVKLLKENIGNMKMGDPTKKSTNIGPMAREELAQKLKRQVDESVKQGAEVLMGGDRPQRKGAFYKPTILTNVKPGMPAYDEELFGPVATILVAEDENEAIALANDTDYGLGASLWTTDKEKGRRLARRLEAGNVFVNSLVKSDPRLPFGGVKKSGYGRELAYLGIKEFTNHKTVWIE